MGHVSRLVKPLRGENAGKGNQLAEQGTAVRSLWETQRSRDTSLVPYTRPNL